MTYNYMLGQVRDLAPVFGFAGLYAVVGVGPELRPFAASTQQRNRRLTG